MTIEYSEKRGFIRMSTESTVSFKKDGTNETYYGQCINLSATGVFFKTDQRIEPGTVIRINITPDLAVVAPLDATIEIIRAQMDSDGGYAVAGQIKQFN